MATRITEGMRGVNLLLDGSLQCSEHRRVSCYSRYDRNGDRMIDQEEADVIPTEWLAEMLSDATSTEANTTPSETYGRAYNNSFHFFAGLPSDRIAELQLRWKDMHPAYHGVLADLAPDKVGFAMWHLLESKGPDAEGHADRMLLDSRMEIPEWGSVFDRLHGAFPEYVRSRTMIDYSSMTSREPYLTDLDTDRDGAMDSSEVARLKFPLDANSLTIEGWEHFVRTNLGLHRLFFASARDQEVASLFVSNGMDRTIRGAMWFIATRRAGEDEGERTHIARFVDRSAVLNPTRFLDDIMAYGELEGPGKARALRDRVASLISQEADERLNRAAKEYAAARRAVEPEELKTYRAGDVPALDASNFDGEVMKHDGRVKLVVLGATYCGVCLSAVDFIQEIHHRDRETTDVFTIDVVANAELARELVRNLSDGENRGIPTFLLFRDGRYVEGVTGYGEDAILKMLDRALKPSSAPSPKGIRNL